MSASFSSPLPVFEDASPVPQYALYGEAATSAAEQGLSIQPLRERLELHHFVIEPHIHPHFEQLIVVRRGGGIMTLEGRDCAFRAPSVLIVPARTVHGFSYQQKAEGWVVTLSKNYFQEIMTRTPDFSDIFAAGNCIEYPRREPAYLEVERAIRKLEWEQRRSARCREIATEALLIDVLVEVLRKVQYGRFPHAADNSFNQEIYRKFVAMVEAHHRDNWSVQKYADALRTSIPRLRAICRSASGESPVTIINTRIILEAKRCLNYTSMGVSEIAYRLGFEDPSYFSRFFKFRCGQTPTEYKDMRKGVVRPPGGASDVGVRHRGPKWHTVR